MSENDQIEQLQKIRSELENACDDLRENIWRKWRDIDTLILRKINAIEKEREIMTNNLMQGGTQ